MIDGLGNSTTGHFMSLVKVLNLGVILELTLEILPYYESKKDSARLGAVYSNIGKYIVNGGKIGFCDACINAGLMTKARTMCNGAFLYYKHKQHLPEWAEINAVMSKLEV